MQQHVKGASIMKINQSPIYCNECNALALAQVNDRFLCTSCMYKYIKSLEKTNMDEIIVKPVIEIFENSQVPEINITFAKTYAQNFNTQILNSQD
jgi:ribosomal protein S27AE